MSLYAWAHGVSAEEAVELTKSFPGLGLVLNARNLHAAGHLGVPPIAYVTTPGQAASVAEAVQDGAKFLAVLVNDERNTTGASGPYMTPEAYAAQFELVKRQLDGVNVPIHTMGLMPVGGFWRTLFWNRLFDDAYHAKLPEADGRAFNPNKVRMPEILRTLDTYDGPWILSPAPFRTFWDVIFEPLDMSDWASLGRRRDVTAVALWCLRETQNNDGTPQFQHGLVDKENNLTTVGVQVLMNLPEAKPPPPSRALTFDGQPVTFGGQEVEFWN